MRIERSLLVTLAIFFGAAPSFGTPIRVRMQDWGYFTRIEADLTKGLQAQGVEVKFEYVYPQLTTPAALSDQLTKDTVDFVTPSVSFFNARTDLFDKLAPVPSTDALKQAGVPESLQQMAPRDSRGAVKCIPVFGGFLRFFYQKQRVKTPPQDLAILDSVASKNLYALPINDPWYLAYLTYEVLKTPAAQRFSQASLNSAAFRAKYKSLVTNAGVLYREESANNPKLNEMNYMLSWGFLLTDPWERAEVKNQLPFYLDCLALSKAGGADPSKRKAFDAIASWLLNPASQAKILAGLPTAFSVLNTTLRNTALNTGLNPEQQKILAKVHAEALSEARDKIR